MYNDKNMNNLNPARKYIHHIQGVLRKSRSYIGVVLIAILALSIAAANNVFAGDVADNSSWLASEYQIPNALESEQAAVYGDTTVRLLYVVSSSSQTLVELEIEDPGIGTESNEETFLPIRPSINLNLLGFSTNDLLGPPQVEVAKGKQRMILDLPPLSEFDTTATIELKDLVKLNPSTGALTTIAGPWHLSFVPNVKTEQLVSRNFNVDKQVEVGDVQILLQRVHISDTETLVFYKIQAMKDIAREPLGQPTLEYTGQVLRTKSKYNIDDSLVLSFPALPDDVNQFTVTFPRMMSLEGPGLSFSISVGEYLSKPYTKDDNIPIDQVVDINAVKFRFTDLTVSENSFTLCYQPFDKNQISQLLLAGPGQVSEVVEATDDNGNHYTVVSAGAIFDRESFKLKEQRITFEGSLDPEASKLNIRINSTGVIGEAFVFNVEVVE